MPQESRIPDPPLRHLFDGTDSNLYDDSVYNLCAGTPGPDLLRPCADLLEQATKHRMAEERKDAFLFQYGTPPGPWDYRDRLSQFLSNRYGDYVDREDLVLTCGATHGLQLILANFLAPNGVVFVEEITYMIAIDVFREYPGLRIVTVPRKIEGIDDASLEEAILQERAKGVNNGSTCSKKPFWAIFYCIPVYNNPTGQSDSYEVCKRVVHLARTHNLLVVCDDVYNLLHYGSGHPPTRLFAVNRSLNSDDLDKPACNVVSNGSFSKILAPGVRVGWLELPGPLALQLRQSGILRSGGGVNAYMAGIISSALELGLIDKNLDNLKEVLGKRMKNFSDALEAALPSGCVFQRPSGGYFLWIQLPPNVDAERFTEVSRKSGNVSGFPGVMFSPSGKYRNYLRLAIAFHGEDRLLIAAKQLGKALSSYLSQI